VTNPATGVSLHGLPLVLAAALAAYLVVVQPVLGPRRHRRFLAALRRDRAARLHRYRRTVVIEWALAAAALLVVALAPGLDAGQVGLRPPRLGAGAPYTVVGGIGLLATVAVFVGVRGRLYRGRLYRGRRPERPLSGPAAVVALLPRTVAERRAFAVLALTAGACEELLYRGFLVAAGTAAVPGLGPVTAVAVSAAVFGLGHLYQGPCGLLGAGLLGGCLAVLYVGSGSLLLPVCYHALLDLRALLLPVPAGRGRGGQHAVVAPGKGYGRARHRA